MYAVLTMARFSAAPKHEHRKRMLRVFRHLKKNTRHGIMVDTRERIIPTTEDVVVNWQEQYPDATKESPPDMPTPKGKTVHITTYMDADHAHDQITKRSVTSTLLFVNNAPTKWYLGTSSSIPHFILRISSVLCSGNKRNSLHGR